MGAAHAVSARIEENDRLFRGTIEGAWNAATSGRAADLGEGPHAEVRTKCASRNRSAAVAFATGACNGVFAQANLGTRPSQADGGTSIVALLALFLFDEFSAKAQQAQQTVSAATI